VNYNQLLSRIWFRNLLSVGKLMVTEMKWKNPNGRRRRPIFLKSKAERHRPTDNPLGCHCPHSNGSFFTCSFPSRVIIIIITITAPGFIGDKRALAGLMPKAAPSIKTGDLWEGRMDGLAQKESRITQKSSSNCSFLRTHSTWFFPYPSPRFGPLRRSISFFWKSIGVFQLLWEKIGGRKTGGG
jgi:hypothetical protein